MGAHVCQSIYIAGHAVVGNFCSFIYDFQTLITGAAAIAAAWYAGSPVWRQLKDSNLQTRIMHREALSVRLHEAEERAGRVAKDIDDPLWTAQRVTSDPFGEPIEIGEHDAHGVEQLILGRLDWYLIILEGTEDARIENTKNLFKAALKDLTDTLGDVHWPAHNDQSGEDYSFTDEEWAEILRKASEGQKLAADKVSAAWAANTALKAAQQTVANELRQRISRLDQSIARNV